MFCLTYKSITPSRGRGFVDAYLAPSIVVCDYYNHYNYYTYKDTNTMTTTTTTTTTTFVFVLFDFCLFV